MEQFTASEVRGQIAWLRNVTVVGTKTTCQMLDAFADLLEAREKAVPVAYAEFADNGCVRMWSRGYEERSPGTQMVPLYTNPAPSDADRLAEALQPFANLLQPHHASIPDDRPIYGINKAEITAGDLRRANEALTANSAQAQPPAAMPEQTHYVAEVIDDCRRRALDLEWDMKNKWPQWSQDEAVLGIICVAQNLQASLGSLGATMKAQPPAASVTDAIARRMVAEYDAVLCGDPTATRTDGMRAALEAALAAQENPNG